LPKVWALFFVSEIKEGSFSEANFSSQVTTHLDIWERMRRPITIPTILIPEVVSHVRISFNISGMDSRSLNAGKDLRLSF
jgi:hypothetical protein